MTFFETEQKYRIRNPARIRASLRKMSARRIANGVESNEFYDQGNFLKKQRVVLRLRTFDPQPATLTLKGPRLRSRFTKRMEIETPIDPATAREFLKFFGCRVRRRYSKRRELYELGRVRITLDFLRKFGWFLEIEGRPPAIKSIEKKLGLHRSDREERSYLQMMFGWKH